MADKKERQKREVPASLQRLLAVDQAVTKNFCDVVDKYLPYTKNRKHYKFLEYTCHALPWFSASLAALWFFWSEDLFQTQVNLIFGILIAGIFQICAKYVFERRGPQDDVMCCTDVNLSSFPSGCASVCSFVAVFFCYLKPLCKPFRRLFIGWAMLVCITRVLSRRHYILDVLVGIFVGYLTGWALTHVWLDQTLVLDCLVIAVMKAVFRRRRPSGNNSDMFLAMGVDAYSFPSGHVSRAIMITYLAMHTIHSNVFIVLLSMVWSVAIFFSRVLLKRHHILDVLGGVFVGFAEGWLISCLWLSRSTAFWLVQFLSEESVTLEG